MEIVIYMLSDGFNATIQGETYPFKDVDHLQSFLKRVFPGVRYTVFVNPQGQTVADTFFGLQAYLEDF